MTSPSGGFETNPAGRVCNGNARNGFDVVLVTLTP